jgi:AcrR family transcriptional regulator
VPTQTPQPRVGRPRDPSRDDAILEAALELLVECGFERMTVEGIAQRAGVGKPTIYRRWPGGKHEVAVEAVLRRRDDRRDPDTGSLRGDLMAIVTQTVELKRRDGRLANGIVAQLHEDREFADLFCEHVVAQERILWRGVVERAHARGELPVPPPTTLYADVAPALISGRILFTGEPVDAAFVAELVDHVLLPILHHTPTTPS